MAGPVMAPTHPIIAPPAPPPTAPPASPPTATPGAGSGQSVVNVEPVDVNQVLPSDAAFRQVLSTGSAYEKTAALAAKGDPTAAAQLDGKYLEFRAACKSFDAVIKSEWKNEWLPAWGPGVRRALVERVVDRAQHPDARFFAAAAEVIGPLENAPKENSDDRGHPERLCRLANTALAGLHQAAMGRDNGSAARLVVLTTPALISFLRENHTAWAEDGKDLSRVKELKSKIGGFSAEGDKAIEWLFEGLDIR
jgi:hypothetical protein